MKRTVRALICVGIFCCFALPSGRAVPQEKRIPVGVKIEAEGRGKGQGMWAQDAKDLTPAELKTLETLVLTNLKKQSIEIVPLSYSKDFIGVAVVVAKLPNGNAGNWYVASSVINVAAKTGTDEFLTHDVFAGADLASVARVIAFQFASVRFQAALGLSN